MTCEKCNEIDEFSGRGKRVIQGTLLSFAWNHIKELHAEIERLGNEFHKLKWEDVIIIQNLKQENEKLKAKLEKIDNILSLHNYYGNDSSNTAIKDIKKILNDNEV